MLRFFICICWWSPRRNVPIANAPIANAQNLAANNNQNIQPLQNVSVQSNNDDIWYNNQIESINISFLFFR